MTNKLLAGSRLSPQLINTRLLHDLCYFGLPASGKHHPKPLREGCFRATKLRTLAIIVVSDSIVSRIVTLIIRKTRPINNDRLDK